MRSARTLAALILTVSALGSLAGCATQQAAQQPSLAPIPSGPLVAMPDVSGRTWREARQILKAKHIAYWHFATGASPAPSDKIAWSDPPAGDPVGSNQYVTFLLLKQ